MARVFPKYGTLLVVGVVLLAGPALAQQYPAWNKPAGTPGTYGTYGLEIKFFDRNNDGKIDQGEFKTGQQVATAFTTLNWSAMDRNHDGQVTRDEFVQSYGTTHTATGAIGKTGRNQATDSIAQTISLKVILNGLAADQRYATEINALRRAVSNWNSDEMVINYLTTHAQQYPNLLPVVRSWVWQFPVRQELRRNFTGDTARPAYTQAKFANAAGRAQPIQQRQQPVGTLGRKPTPIQAANARPATPYMKPATKPHQQTAFKPAPQKPQNQARKAPTGKPQQRGPVYQR